MIYLSLIALVGGIAVGMPIALAFLSVTVFLIFWTGLEPSFLLPYSVSMINNPSLLAFSMFILGGFLMARGKIGERIVDFVEIFVGRLRGGIGAALVLGCAAFGSVTGSVAATCTAIGSAMIPRLTAGGYPKGYSAALLANAAILGMLIPPSGLMVVYGWIAGQSILALFAAIVIPGLILATLLVACNFVMARKFLPKQHAGSDPGKQTAPRIPGRRRRVTLGAMPAMAMPIIILGGIYAGIFTPTEAAAVSAFYAIPVGLWVYRGLKTEDIMDSLIRASVMAGAIIVMLMSALMLGRIYVMEGVPAQILSALTAVSSEPWMILLMINLFLVLVGTIMDDLSGVLLTTPLLLPLVKTLGVDPVQFGALLAVNLGMGLVTPPAAPLLSLAGFMSGAKMKEMINPTLVFMLFAWLPTLLLVSYVPQVSLWLPSLLLGR